MIFKLSALLTQYIEENTCNLNSNDAEKINYAIVVILSETLKLIFLFFIFILLGKIRYFIFSLAILLSIRIFAGGFHASNSVGCTLFSTLFFLCTCVFVLYIPYLSNIFYWAFSITSVVLNVLYSPRPSKKRPIIKVKRRIHLKLISVVSTLIWIYILFFMINDVSLFQCGIFTIFLQSIQLLNFKEVFSNEK